MLMFSISHFELLSLWVFTREICHPHLNLFTSSCRRSGFSLDPVPLAEEDSP